MTRQATHLDLVVHSLRTLVRQQPLSPEVMQLLEYLMERRGAGMAALALDNLKPFMERNPEPSRYRNVPAPRDTSYAQNTQQPAETVPP